MAMENHFEIPYLVYLKITLKYENLHVIEITTFSIFDFKWWCYKAFLKACKKIVH